MIIAPDVTPQPIPNVKEQPAASETTFGGGPGLEAEGAGVQKIAQDAGDIAAFEKIRANQMAVEDAQAKGSKLTTDVLYDPQTGVLGSHGKDALQSQKDGMDRLQKGMNDISTTLNGEQQKGAFNKWALSQVDVANHHMMAHVDEQLKSQDAESFKNLVDNSAAQVALGHGNPDTLKQVFGTVNDNTVAFAARNRLDPDQTKELVQNTNDKMHTAVIDGMMKFQTDDSAQKYYDAHKDEISPEAQLKITNALDEHNIRWRASSAATDILKDNPNSEADALKAAGKISNPEIQDTARKLISARFSEDRQAKKNDQDDTFMRMQQMVNQKGLTDPIDRRMAIPAMAWNKLSAEQQRAIEKGGGTDVTSPKAYLAFSQQIKDGTLKDLSQADLMSKYLVNFKPEDQKQAMELWSGARGGKPSQRLMDEQNIQKSIETNLVNEKLIAPKSSDRGQSQHSLMFDVMDNVHRDYEAQQSSLGRNLKPEEAQAIVDKATLKAIAKKPVGWFSNEPISFESIPDRAKSSLMLLGRQNGFAVDKIGMEKAWQMHLQGKSDADIIKALKNG